MKIRWPFLVVFIACGWGRIAESAPRESYLLGALDKDEPQPIYDDNPHDPWNVIFYHLFTRATQARLAADFVERQSDRPVETVEAMGFRQLTVSKGTFQRIDGGDAAIEPLYPAFFSIVGPSQVLKEPRYSQLQAALTEALRTAGDQPPPKRAIIQADAWAAHDVLARYSRAVNDDGEMPRAQWVELLSLLARFIKQLALSPEEIKALPDNYAAAAKSLELPPIFDPTGGWLEFGSAGQRLHEDAANDRRATRVFIKPRTPPRDKQTFLNDLSKAAHPSAELAEVALVVQNLLVDSSGDVAVSPLVYDVQLRKFVYDQAGKLIKTEVRQLELSRRRLLTSPETGGLVAHGEDVPAYLPDAGNDYGFASRQVGARRSDAPILAPLSKRCVACHGDRLEIIFQVKSSSPLVELDQSENERALEVAKRKAARDDFQQLKNRWNR